MGREQRVDELILAITTKLRANQQIVASSLNYGRLTWRMTKEGRIEVDLEPKL